MATLKSSSAAPQRPQTRLTRLLQRRNWLALASAVWLAGAFTFTALRQQPTIHPDRVLAPWSWEWFSQPIERNAWMRLPHVQLRIFDTNLLGVTAVDGGRRAWVTTSQGDLARSDDAGQSWTVLPKSSLPPVLQGPVFQDRENGWLLTDESPSRLWATRDGGLSWAPESFLRNTELPRALWVSGSTVYCLTNLSVWSSSKPGGGPKDWSPFLGLNVSDFIPKEPDRSDMLAVAQNTFLLINSQGITLIDRKDSGFTHRSVASLSSGDRVRSIRIDGDSRYLLLTTVGLAVIDPSAPTLFEWSPRWAPDPSQVELYRTWWWWAVTDGVLQPSDLLLRWPSPAGLKSSAAGANEGWTGFALASSDNGQPRVSFFGSSTVWRSQGATWERSLMVGQTFGRPFVDSRGHIWLGSNTGDLLRSRDRGSSWEWQASVDGAIEEIRVSPENNTGYLQADARYRFEPDRVQATLERLSRPVSSTAPNTFRCGDFDCRGASLIKGKGWGIRQGKDPDILINDALVFTRGEGTWTVQPLPTSERIADVLALGDGVGLAFGTNQSIFRTSNWGNTWEPITHAVYPAPWYYVSWLWVLGLVWLGRKKPKPRVAEALGGHLTSDRPIDESSRDVLGLHEIALGLSRFLRNDQTEPSLTLAVTGAWGTGKSSLLNLLRWDLWHYGLRPVSFNAWHNEQQGSPVAALYDAIIREGLPPLLSPDGLRFRARLLLVRGQRHSVKLGFTFLAVLFAAAYYFSAPERFIDSVSVITDLVARLVKLLGGSDTASSQTGASDSATRWFGVLVTIVSLVSVSQTLRSRLQAFGVDPSKLLATLQGSTKAADTKESVGFHARFAEEFREVTRALPYRTVILVDDLERCSPANMLKMLEAINFLTSSGDCFVVMAVSYEVLKAYMRLELKIPPPAETADAPPRDPAEHYLEKLIHVEVAVPQMTPEHARRLVGPSLADAAREQRLKMLERAQRSRVAVELARRFLGWGFFATVAALCILLGWWARPALAPAAQGPVDPTSAPAATATQQPGTSNPQAAPAPQPNGAAAPTGAPSSQKDAKASSSQESQQGIALQEITEDPLTARWVGPGVLALLGMLLLAITRSSGGVVVTDSPSFQQALATWMPLIVQRHPTPRALKRFLNRLRYYAMRQGRTEDDEEGPLVAFIHGWMEAAIEFRHPMTRMRKALRSALTRGKSLQAQSDPPPDTIPDTWLVALTTAVEWEDDKGAALLGILKDKPPAEPAVPSVVEAAAANLAQLPAPQPSVTGPNDLLKTHPASNLISTETRGAWEQTKFGHEAVNDPQHIAKLYEALRRKTGEALPGGRHPS